MTITEMTAPTAAKLRWWALAVLMLPVLLVAVDNTVLSFAIPMISEALRPTGVELLWIVDVYPLVLAGLLIPMGSLGDRFGRRRLLLVGATGFAVVSAVAAFAPTAGALIAARAAMGFFGAMLMPATLSLIRNIFVDPQERRLAIAVWAAGFSGGAALGPLVGGFLLEHFWWGSVFLLAVPVLLPLLIAGLLVLPESKDPNPGRVDVLSTILILVTMVALVWGIKSIAVYGPGLDLAVSLVSRSRAASGSSAASSATTTPCSTSGCSPTRSSAVPSAPTCSACSRWSVSCSSSPNTFSWFRGGRRSRPVWCCCRVSS
jgi:DHA2 family multidrug resistance protein-like MFS transporter